MYSLRHKLQDAIRDLSERTREEGGRSDGGSETHRGFVIGRGQMSW